MKFKKVLALLSLLLCVLLLSSCATVSTLTGESSAAAADGQAEQNAPPTDAGDNALPAEAVNAEDLSALSSISAERLEFKTKDFYTDYDGATVIDPAKAGNGYRVADGIVEIVEGGTYVLSGSFEGQLLIKAGNNDDVRIVLENATLSCDTTAPIYAENADKVIISIPEGTESRVTDVVTGTDKGETLSGAIYAECDLSINGTGTLIIEANANDGVNTKDDLHIVGTTLQITAADDGLVANDGILLRDAVLNITAAGDGVKASKAVTDKGFICIESGSYSISAESDGFQAETCLFVKGGEFEITTGGGAANAPVKTGQDMFGGWQNSQKTEDTVSAKGLKAGAYLEITGGAFVLDTADDALHSNGSLLFQDGAVTASTGDDGMHADSRLEIAGGTVSVLNSCEGIEAGEVVISGGVIDVYATDDGLNAAGGKDASSLGGRPGMNAFDVDSTKTITITGGTIYVNALGDGIDSNGSITMTGGEVYVSGPTDSANGILDFDTTFDISGGTLLGVGSAGMLQIPSGEQGTVVISANGSAGSTVAVRNTAGEVMAEYIAPKNYSIVLFSAPGLVDGETYTALIDGNEAGSGICGENVAGIGGFGGGMGGFGGRGQGGGRGGMDGQFGGRSDGGRMQGGKMPGDGEMPGGNTPPEMPNGEMPQEGGTPPGMSNGEMPQMGEAPPEMPDGGQPMQSGALPNAAGIPGDG